MAILLNSQITTFKRQVIVMEACKIARIQDPGQVLAMYSLIMDQYPLLGLRKNIFVDYDNCWEMIPREVKDSLNLVNPPDTRGKVTKYESWRTNFMSVYKKYYESDQQLIAFKTWKELKNFFSGHRIREQQERDEHKVLVQNEDEQDSTPEEDEEEQNDSEVNLHEDQDVRQERRRVRRPPRRPPTSSSVHTSSGTRRRRHVRRRPTSSNARNPKTRIPVPEIYEQEQDQDQEQEQEPEPREQHEEEKVQEEKGTEDVHEQQQAEEEEEEDDDDDDDDEDDIETLAENARSFLEYAKSTGDQELIKFAELVISYKISKTHHFY
jgi:hypothetical protein